MIKAYKNTLDSYLVYSGVAPVDGFQHVSKLTWLSALLFNCRGNYRPCPRARATATYGTCFIGTASSVDLTVSSVRYEKASLRANICKEVAFTLILVWFR